MGGKHWATKISIDRLIDIYIYIFTYIYIYIYKTETSIWLVWNGVYNIFFYLAPSHKYLDQFSIVYCMFRPRPGTRENKIWVTDFLEATSSHSNAHPRGICPAIVTHNFSLDIPGTFDHSSSQARPLKWPSLSFGITQLTAHGNHESLS